MQDNLHIYEYIAKVNGSYREKENPHRVYCVWLEVQQMRFDDACASNQMVCVNNKCMMDMIYIYMYI